MRPGFKGASNKSLYKDTSGLEVVGITVHGGGHTTPGGCQYEPIFSVGRTNRDIIAADEVWAFFARHTR